MMEGISEGDAEVVLELEPVVLQNHFAQLEREAKEMRLPLLKDKLLLLQ